MFSIPQIINMVWKITNVCKNTIGHWNWDNLRKFRTYVCSRDRRWCLKKEEIGKNQVLFSRYLIRISAQTNSTALWTQARTTGWPLVKDCITGGWHCNCFLMLLSFTQHHASPSPSPQPCTCPFLGYPPYFPSLIAYPVPSPSAPLTNWQLSSQGFWEHWATRRPITASSMSVHVHTSQPSSQNWPMG